MEHRKSSKPWNIAANLTINEASRATVEVIQSHGSWDRIAAAGIVKTAVIDYLYAVDHHYGLLDGASYLRLIAALALELADRLEALDAKDGP